MDIYSFIETELYQWDLLNGKHIKHFIRFENTGKISINLNLLLRGKKTSMNFYSKKIIINK